MWTEEDIYKIYRQAQGRFNDKPVRYPKDWPKFFMKMDKRSKLNLEIITKYFNTKWANLNPHDYFDCGFKLLGFRFRYLNFFNPKILQLYISQDKAHKREMDDVEDDIIKSVEYICRSIDGPRRLDKYLEMKSGRRQKILQDYINNKIGKFFVTYLLREKILRIPRVDQIQFPYLIEQYPRNLDRLNKFEKIIDVNNLIKKVYQ